MTSGKADKFSPEAFLTERSDFQEVKVVERLEGDNNRNFVFRADGEKYVLRKSREISEDEETLENEMKVLKFLEEQGIESVPRSILFDSEEEVHVTSYVGEEPVNVEDMNEEELSRWAEKLVEINGLSFQQFQEFCEKEGYSYDEPEKPDERLERFSWDIEDLKGSSEEEELIEFVDEKLEELKQAAGNRDCEEASLMHSDIAGSTRRDDEDFYFIDWEFADFGYGPFMDLAIIFTHRDLTESQISALKEAYFRKVNISGNADQELNRSKKFRHLFNIIWCLGRLPKSKGSERERYLNFARKQRNEYSEEA